VLADLGVSTRGRNTSLPSCVHPEPIKRIFYPCPQTRSLFSAIEKEAAKTARRLKPKDATADKDTVKEAGLLKKTDGIVNLDVILDIPLEITVELGRTKIPIHELLEIGPGSAVSLSTLEGESVDILANNTLIAKGVVLVKNEKYGIRITKITSSMDRIKSLV
jgi:flagellar motor switch protein FliN